MSRNHAVVPISLDLLRIILDIPAGIDVVGILEMDSRDRERGECRLLVFGDALPKVAEGGQGPKVELIHTRVESGNSFLSEMKVEGRTLYHQRVINGEVVGEWLVGSGV